MGQPAAAMAQAVVAAPEVAPAAQPVAAQAV
jgi:hypothetical protein